MRSVAMLARNDHDALVHAAATDFFAVSDFFASLVGDAFLAAFLTLAHRAFWAAAILVRVPALKVRFFLLFAPNPTAGAFFAVDAAAAIRAAFFTAFLDFAQRALWAAAIFSRAWALKVRFALALVGLLALAGRLDLWLSVVRMPDNSAFACRSLDISASISTTMSRIFMNPPVMRITHRVNFNSAPHCRLLLIGVQGRDCGRDPGRI